MGVDGENDCLSRLQQIDWIREYAPSYVIKCRHRTYTEAERKFLDYIDEKLEETYFSFFKLNSIDYGDQKHKFVFPIMSHGPLRVALWDEVLRGPGPYCSRFPTSTRNTSGESSGARVAKGERIPQYSTTGVRYAYVMGWRFQQQLPRRIWKMPRPGRETT